MSSAYERIGRLLRQRHLQALPRDVFWNRWTLAINTAISALTNHQAGAAPIPGGRQLPLDRFTSSSWTALTGMLTA